MAVVRVRDTGVGISAEVLPRLFQAFEQAEQTIGRSRGGLGLGLALVKGFVQIHGGEVEVHSDGPGKGAEFTIRLHLDEAATIPSRAEAEKRGCPPRRVLVIEDNADAASSLREVLELGDHVVEVASDGPQGIAKARRFQPEILLCDIGLPEMDGYAVARAFRADETLRSVYLVALTGYALPEDLAKAKDAGFDHHLAKPPSMDQIEHLLTHAPGPGAPK